MLDSIKLGIEEAATNGVLNVVCKWISSQDQELKTLIRRIFEAEDEDALNRIFTSPEDLQILLKTIVEVREKLKSRFPYIISRILEKTE